MAKTADLIRFQKFSGINNLSQPWELDSDELVTATNADITKAKRLSLRAGRTKIITGNFSNLWSNDNVMLATLNGNLVIVYPDDKSYTVIRTEVGDNPMSYVTINDIVVYSNYYVIGYVKDEKDNAFPLPTDNFKFSFIPGQLLEYYRGRLFIARDNVIWFSDVLAERFGSLDKRGNGRQMPSRITMIKAVDDGIWISDETDIYFAQGLDPYSLTLNRVSTYTAIYGLAAKIDIKLLPYPMRVMNGTAYAIGTNKGVCIISNNGFCENVTERKYRMPQGTSGNMLFRRAENINQIISVINQ